MLRVGKLTDSSGYEQLVKITNLSAGGVMALSVARRARARR